MKTHAPQVDTASVAARVAQLPHLPMDSLWALWDEHFDERPNHHHRTWLETRLAYKIQERAFGGLKGSVRRKLEEIGETGILPPRLRREADTCCRARSSRASMTMSSIRCWCAACATSSIADSGSRASRRWPR